MKKAIVLVCMALLVLAPVFSTGVQEEASKAPAKVIKLSDVKPTLKVLLQPSSTDPNIWVDTQHVEAITGYDLEISTLPTVDRDQALMLLMSSGTDFDVINFTGPNNFATLFKNGALLPLNDYIDAIAPGLWKDLSTDAWAGVSDEDGNVYGFPFFYPYPMEVTSYIIVRNDLLKAAGIEKVPVTLKEFRDTLVKLKAFYGDKYIPLTGPYKLGTAGNMTNYPYCIASAFGIYNDWMVDKNGKVIYITEHPRFKEFIEFMNGLYKDGLLDPDYASNNYKNTEERFSSGRAIMAMTSRESAANLWKGITALGNLTMEDFKFVLPLYGEDGTCVYMKNTAYNSYFCIPASNPGKAADVVGFANEIRTNQERVILGEEGVHFYRGDDGFPRPIQPKFTDERNNAWKLAVFVHPQEYARQWMARVRKTDWMWYGFESVTIRAEKERPDMYVEAYFALNNDPAYAANNAVLFNDLNDYVIQLIVGAKKLDTSIAEFTKKWANNEGEAVRKGLQAWYDKNF